MAEQPLNPALSEITVRVSRRMRVSLAAALVMCGALAGCTSSGDGEPQPTLSPAEVQAVLQGAGSNQEFLDSAEQQLIARCMRKAGFEYQPVPPASPGVPNPFIGTTLDGLDVASEGYGLRAEDGAGQAHNPNPNAAIVAAMSNEDRARYTLAWRGPRSADVRIKVGDTTIGAPGAGCVGEARKAIYGDLKVRLRLVNTRNNLLAEPSSLVESDSELIAARKKWSACMKDAGFDYASRRAAKSDLNKRYEAKGADANAVLGVEIATATADQKCSNSIGYDDTLKKVQNRLIAEAVTKHEGDLIAMKELNAASVARAKKALAAS